MGDVAGQREFRAREVGLKIVERPGVVRLKAQFGLNVVERERVRRRERPDEFALAQNKSVNLPLPVQQRAKVQLQLDFGQRRAPGSSGVFGVADADVFGDQPVDETQPHPGEFQFDSARCAAFPPAAFSKNPAGRCG